MANMNMVNILHKGKAMCFLLERKFNGIKRTVTFDFIPTSEKTEPMQLVYDNVEHIFKPNCDILKTNGDLRYNLEKYLRETLAA
jgi:hypothetical protein